MLRCFINYTLYALACVGAVIGIFHAMVWAG